jgi:CarD family transcriptional regulator, regulator of rRNA transcription
MATAKKKSTKYKTIPKAQKKANVKTKTHSKTAVKSKAKSSAHAAKPIGKAKPAAKPAAKAPERLRAKAPAAKPVAKAVAHPPKPVTPVVARPPAAVVKPHAPPAATVPAAPAAPKAAPPAGPKKLPFKINELIVYPAHGVGRIVQIEEQEIAGAKLELYIIDFEKEKLRLKVPTNKSEQKGMRKLADKPLIEQAMRVLRGRARIKRTMWSRRAQEYEAKINSGDLIAVAEVVRDLYRSEKQPEQSYSERQLFEQALERMAREIAAVKKIDDDVALKELEGFLEKNAHRNVKAEEEAAPAEAAA